MRPFLVAALLFAAAPAAFAQEEYDLGNALAERGWYDLAEEIFDRIGKSATLSPDQKAEGEYGLARLNIQMAERADSTDEKSKLFQKAIDAIEGFRKKFPAHRLAAEALSDIAYVYQSKGKAFVTASKADPAKMEEAEKAFAAAEKLFQDLIASLKKAEVKLPEDPQKDAKGLAAFMAWEEKMMFAKYNYALALFSHAETFKDNASKHPDMKRLLEAMNKFLNDDFMWVYETYLLAYDAFIYMGRAYQLLAETSDREKAEQNWQQCFVYLGKPRGLLSDKEARKNDAVREIACRALLFEMKARGSYGDIKRGCCRSIRRWAPLKSYLRTRSRAKRDSAAKASSAFRRPSASFASFSSTSRRTTMAHSLSRLSLSAFAASATSSTESRIAASASLIAAS